MRLAELVLLAATIVGVVRPATRLVTRPWLAWVVVGVVAASTVVHLLVEGARWQLTPLYLAAAVAVLAGVADGVRPPTSPTGRAGWALLAVLAVLGGAVGWVLPVPVFPPPTGPHAVGTKVVVLTDEDRPAGYGAAPSAPRELVLQVWYPADPEAPVRPGPWVPAGAALGRPAASWLGLPIFVLDHVGLVRSNATSDVPATPEPGPLPVVVYTHGWGGFRTIQSDLAESLASEGTSSPRSTTPTEPSPPRSPTARSCRSTRTRCPPVWTPRRYDAAAERLVATFADDVAFLLDELEAGAVPMLAGRLDLESVGIVGHSTGGGAAVRLCATEVRCGAIVGLDPWVEPVPDADRRGRHRRPVPGPAQRGVGRQRQRRTAASPTRVLDRPHRSRRARRAPPTVT